MGLNSREKGKRGERLLRDLFIEHGFPARRGQQFAGGTDSPDVIVPDLPDYHLESKFVEKLDVYKAMEQAVRDAGHKTPLVFHKKSRTDWHVTIRAEDFFELITALHDKKQHDHHCNCHTDHPEPEEATPHQAG